jgi:hypothetical protein
MFGYIWRENTKQLKNLVINTNKIAVQVLGDEEELTEDHIVVLLKQRNV